MKKRIILFIIALQALNGLAQIKNLEIGGGLEYDAIAYFENEDSKINGRNQGIFNLRCSSGKDASVSWVSSIEIREDLIDTKRSRFYIDELYMKIPFKKFDLVAGKQLVNWSTTDVVSPTNVINPTDYSDIIDVEDEEIGEYMIKVDYYFKNLSLEGVFIPVTQFSILPTANSRWYPFLPQTAPHPMIPNTDVGVGYEFKKASVKYDFSRYDIAFKLNYTLKGNDIALSYFNGYNNMPYVETSIKSVELDTVLLNIEEKVYKQQMIGINYESFIRNVGVKFESAYINPYNTHNDSLIDDPYIHSVFAVERIFSELAIFNNIHIILQYSYEYSLGRKELKTNDLRHVFQKSFLFNFSFDVGNYVTFENQFAYNLISNDYLLSNSISYSVTDGLTIEASNNLFFGQRDTFFGQYQKNDRVQIKVSYKF